MTRSLSFEKAKARYPHRYTLEHTPEWAKRPHYDEFTHDFVGYYKPHYKTDKEWYDNTCFPGENGIAKHERHCESNNQSWPLGRGFSEKPCVKGQV
jgi:hypothetical protein